MIRVERVAGKRRVLENGDEISNVGFSLCPADPSV